MIMRGEAAGCLPASSHISPVLFPLLLGILCRPSPFRSGWSVGEIEPDRSPQEWPFYGRPSRWDASERPRRVVGAVDGQNRPALRLAQKGRLRCGAGLLPQRRDFGWGRGSLAKGSWASHQHPVNFHQKPGHDSETDHQHQRREARQPKANVPPAFRVHAVTLHVPAMATIKRPIDLHLDAYREHR